MGDMNAMLANRLAMMNPRETANSNGGGGGGGGGSSSSSSNAVDEDKEYRQHPTNPDMLVEVKQQPTAVQGGGGGGEGKSGKKERNVTTYVTAPMSDDDLSCWQSTMLCLQQNRNLSIYLGVAFFSLVPGLTLVNATSKSSVGYIVGTVLLGVFVLLLMGTLVACFGSLLSWCCLHEAEHHACFKPSDVCRCKIGFCYKRRAFPVLNRRKVRRGRRKRDGSTTSTHDSPLLAPFLLRPGV